MKKVMGLLLALAAIALVADPAWAQQLPAEAAGSLAATKTSYFIAVVVTAGFAMAIASAFCALGQGRAIAAALDGMARQPSLAGRLQVVMIVGLALIESLAIYVLLIALILFFASPFDAKVMGLS